MKDFYMATSDKVLIEEQERVFQENDRLIKKYNSLPFYKKWFVKDVRNEVLDNWRNFDRFQENRFREMSKNNSFNFSRT